MTLYEIDKSIEFFINENLDEETGEILNIEAFAELQMAREKKLENIALYIKNLKAEADAIKSEIDNLTKRKQSAEQKADRLKKLLQDALEGCKLSTSKVSVSYRRSMSVDVVDVLALTDEYLKYSEPTPRKDLLKKALQNGEVIAGAELVEKTSLQIR